MKPILISLFAISLLTGVAHADSKCSMTVMSFDQRKGDSGPVDTITETFLLKSKNLLDIPPIDGVEPPNTSKTITTKLGKYGVTAGLQNEAGQVGTSLSIGKNEVNGDRVETVALFDKKDGLESSFQHVNLNDRAAKIKIGVTLRCQK